MNKVLKPFWILLVALIGVVALSLWNRHDEKELIPWRNDLRAASAEAQASNKPLFLYFTASWCGPCQSLKTTTWADADVEKELSHFVPVKIDVDEHPEIARQYPSDGIPHFVIAKQDGTMVRDTVGAYPPKDLIEWLQGKAL